MAYKKKYKPRRPRRRRYGVRRAYRRYKRYGPNDYAGRLTKGFPSVFSTKLNYEYRVIQATGAPTLTYYNRINANSLYDPENAVGGAQPALFDNLMAIYKWFRVYGVKIMITFTQTNSASDGMEVCAFYKGDSTTDVSSQSSYDWHAQPINRRSAVKVTNINSNQKVVVSKFFNLRRLEKDLLTSVNYTGTASADPSALRYIDWCVYNPNGATNNMYFDAHVVLTYYARFEQPYVTEVMAID